jgi:hypothetical protein
MPPSAKSAVADSDPGQVLTSPLKGEALLKMWRENDGEIRGLVALDLSDLFGGFEGFLDALSVALVGHDCLMNVDYTLRGVSDGSLVFEASGSLESEPEGD